MYDSEARYEVGCWISIQRGAIQLVWGEGTSLQYLDLTREEVLAIHRLQHGLRESSDWSSPTEAGEAWSDLPAVPWIVAFMDIIRLDTSRRYNCFNVAVPAHLIPDEARRSARLLQDESIARRLGTLAFVVGMIAWLATGLVPAPQAPRPSVPAPHVRPGAQVVLAQFCGAAGSGGGVPDRMNHDSPMFHG